MNNVADPLKPLRPEHLYGGWIKRTTVSETWFLMLPGWKNGHGGRFIREQSNRIEAHGYWEITSGGDVQGTGYLGGTYRPTRDSNGFATKLTRVDVPDGDTYHRFPLDPPTSMSASVSGRFTAEIDAPLPAGGVE